MILYLSRLLLWKFIISIEISKYYLNIYLYARMRFEPSNTTRVSDLSPNEIYRGVICLHVEITQLNFNVFPGIRVVVIIT